MISFCTFVRDVPHLPVLIQTFRNRMDKIGIDYEICIGDNSQQDGFFGVSGSYYHVNELADVYVPISDKEVYRMGIPWCHNRVVAEANSYKIFYIDGDEYPIWVHPEIEDHYDLTYVLGCLRYDFLTHDQIMEIEHAKLPLEELREHPYLKGCEMSRQDRLYNCRYAKFEGLCHSIFHVPDHFRERTTSAVLLHDSTVRDQKNLERMRAVIREGYARQNINPSLASSQIVLGWGKGWKHTYENFEEFKEAWDN